MPIRTTVTRTRNAPPARPSTRVENSPTGRGRAIRDLLDSGELSFIRAGYVLKKAFEARDWEAFQLKSFSEYCTNVVARSPAYCYALVQIAELSERFPNSRDRIARVGISNMRLLLPHIGEQTSARDLDGMLDEAEGTTWEALRHTLRDASRGGGGEVLPPWADAKCPLCGGDIELSRAANVRKSLKSP